MLPIPICPEALPDEIIGSRLTRIIDVNALGFKSVLLKWLGFERSRRGAQFMDVSVLTKHWLDLAERLLIDPNELLDLQSTKPYWACFYTRSRHRAAISTFEDPRLAALSVPESVLFDRNRTRTELQLCPCCLKEDAAAYGAPYVHRSHQLPATMVCYKHRAYLLHRCPWCEKVLMPHLDLARGVRECECGNDLASAVAYCRPASIEYKLAVFEHSCLHSVHQYRSAADAIAFLEWIAAERHQSIQDLVTDALGPHFNSWRRFDPNRVSVHSQFRPADDGMPAIAAGFVSLGFDFEEAQAALACEAPIPKPKPKPKPSRHPRRLPHPSSVSEARAGLKHLNDSGQPIDWHHLHRSSPYLFWFLLLRDRPWLEAQIGRPRWNAVSAIPSIEEDRVALLQGSAFQARDEARARAYCRDKAWLERSRLERNLGKRASRSEALVQAVRLKMSEALMKPGRPVKFTRRSAAAAAGMSLSGFNSFLKRNPSSRSLLFESATTYRTRLLLWALRERASSKVRLSPWLVVKHAGLGDNHRNRFHAASIIHSFSTVGSDLTAWT